ncbi:predicted protein [Naegleria gruberi]|uniref:Predicted protein n=1 Tax=Naegleria gruberi TaxID=5762 RepID=D2VK99_NAEGR|nr:uncharacterized protein NAEGRDRAFT_69319 [Naegleria gruberi]EFC42913.1 predicted protein [Naegleria gruberi]|eukprot:XP_002675657.1 predicted protein [Naegleria gruberi strain NEG-M]
MSSSTPINLLSEVNTTPTSNVGTPLTSTPINDQSNIDVNNPTQQQQHSQLADVNYWDKIQKILKKMENEVQQVNDNGLVHPLHMSDNILERRESLKHAISIIKQRVEEQLTIKPRAFLEKTQQQSKSVKEFNRIQLQERELLDAIQKCTEKVLTQYQHQQIIERILNSVAKEMNEFIGKEDYAALPITDLISSSDLVTGYSMGCDILNLDVEFTETKELKSIKFQKTKQGNNPESQHKEIKPISEDLMSTLVKDRNPELFEKKLLDVCKLYHLVASRPNCIVTDKASLRSTQINDTSSFLKSTSVMREFEHYITREGNFPSDKVSIICEGVSINYFRDRKVIVTLEGCAGNALQQTCPVMVFTEQTLIPLYTAKNLNFLQSIISSLKKSSLEKQQEPENILPPDFTRDMSVNEQYNRDIRVLETFQNCLLSGYSTSSTKKVQSSVYNFVSTTSNISEKLATNSGVFIRRVPFLNFDQMRFTLAVMKKHMLLNDILLSCFSQVQDSSKGLLDNICTHNTSGTSRHHTDNSNQRRVEVEYSTPSDIIYIKTTTDNDFVEIRVEYDQEKEQPQVYVNQNLNTAMSELLNKTYNIPIMVHYFFTKVSMQLN